MPANQAHGDRFFIELLDSQGKSLIIVPPQRSQRTSPIPNNLLLKMCVLRNFLNTGKGVYMFAHNDYIARLTNLLLRQFGERLCYVGLQGSYLRGEATEQSDLDVMVVLNELCAADLASYRRIVDSMENSGQACGFICGKDELAHWNACEICQLLHTTKDYYGCQRDLTPTYTMQDEITYIKISLNNLYHELCHRYIHATSEENTKRLPFSYKSAFFILQNIHFLCEQASFF